MQFISTLTTLKKPSSVSFLDYYNTIHFIFFKDLLNERQSFCSILPCVSGSKPCILVSAHGATASSLDFPYYLSYLRS